MFIGIEYLHLFLFIVFSLGDLASGRFSNLSKKIEILGSGFCWQVEDLLNRGLRN